MNKNESASDFLLRLKRDLIDFVNTTLDAAAKSIELSEGEVISIDVPLMGHTAFFKGRKPTAVIFPNGTEAETPKWKSVAQAIIQDCIQSPDRYEYLLSLRGKISGKNRTLLSATPDNMDSPLLVAEGLYLESKFDTETLLNVLLDRVLKPVGYDASGILIRVKL